MRGFHKRLLAQGKKKKNRGRRKKKRGNEEIEREREFIWFIMSGQRK